MANLLSDWREALVTLLETSFPTAQVLSGEPPETVSRDKDRIYVFWADMAEASDVNFAMPRIAIRYFVGKPKTTLKPVPQDDGPLEQAGWDLATALQPVQTTLDPAQRYYFRITALRPVRDEYAVEALLLAWTLNPASLQVS